MIWWIENEPELTPEEADMARVYREIHERPEDLKPVQTFTTTEGGNER